MAKQTSFSHQKVVLEQFSTMLSSLEQELRNLSKKYEDYVHDLYEEQGLIEEIYADYKETYLESMKYSLLELSERIASRDIPFVEKEIDFISSR